MQGTGNDYIYVDCFRQPIPPRPDLLAREISDRHFGVGGDGLILICPSGQADARMRMFNADGSESEMCGNGIRCVAKYVYDHDLCQRENLRIETGRGVLDLNLQVADGRVQRVRVDMGEPIVQPAFIPTTFPGDKVVDADLNLADTGVGGRTLRVTCVSMGNPHCITYVDEPSDEMVLGLGPKVETDPHFPPPRERRVRPGALARRSPHAGLGTGFRRDPGLWYGGLCGVCGRRLERSHRA